MTACTIDTEVGDASKGLAVEVALRIAVGAIAGGVSLSVVACGGSDGRPGSAFTVGTATVPSSDSSTGKGGSTAASPPTSTGSEDGTSGSWTTEGDGSGPVASSSGSVVDSSGASGSTCVSGSVKQPVTISDATQSVKIPLPLLAATRYDTVNVSATFVVPTWNGTCFNPAAGSNQNEFPVFQALLALKRGNHWCKGGNAFTVSAQGPDGGRLIAQTFYRHDVWQGEGCGDPDIQADIFGIDHSLSAGGTYAFDVAADFAAGTFRVEMDGHSYSGTFPPEVEVVGSDAEPWTLVFSFDGGYLGCFGEAGDDRCCHIPSLNWTYSDISYSACTTAG